MNPDAAPTLAPIAVGRDGEGDLIGELDSVAGDMALQAVGVLRVLSDVELDLMCGVGAVLGGIVALEGAVLLEIDVGVSIQAATGMK